MDYKAILKSIKTDADLQELIIKKVLEVNTYQKGSLTNLLDWILSIEDYTDGKVKKPYNVNSYTVTHKIGTVWVIKIS